MAYVRQRKEPKKQSSLSASDDILGALHLDPLYDEFVRPYIDISGEPNQPPKGSNIIKINRSTGIAEPKKKRKFPKDYVHLAPNIGGHVTVKKNNLLRDLVLDPSVQSVKIEPFSDKIMRNAFSLEPGVLEGFDPEAWADIGIESDRKKKKKRKE